MKYPKHIYDEERIKIGKLFIQKRTRKLFPSLNQSIFETLDKDINRWLIKVDDTQIRDFWDDVYAFKFETARKYWVNYLTAENVNWSLQKFKLEDVLINWPRVTQPNLDTILGEPPYTYSEIIKYIQNNHAIKKQMIENSDEHSSNTSLRDNYPVVGMLIDGKLSLEDGNRRTLRKILYGDNLIEVYIGQMNGAEPKNYWVSTGWFWQIVLVASRDDDELNKYKAILKEIFEQSEVARITYRLGVSSGFFAERNTLAKKLIQ